MSKVLKDKMISEKKSEIKMKKRKIARQERNNEKKNKVLFNQQMT